MNRTIAKLLIILGFTLVLKPSLQSQDWQVFDSSYYHLHLVNDSTFFRWSNKELFKEVNHQVMETFEFDLSIQEVNYFESGKIIVGCSEIQGEGVLFISEDFGQNWNEIDVPQMGWIATLHFVNELTGFVGTGDGDVFRTNDGGLTWDKTNVNPETGVDKIEFVCDSIGFVIGDGNKEFFSLYTIDGGENWLNWGLKCGYGCVDFSVLNDSIVYTIAYDRIWRNNIKSSASDLLGSPPGGSFKMVHFINDSTGIVGCSPDIDGPDFPDSTYMYITHNAGVTWSRQTTEYQMGIIQRKVKYRENLLISCPPVVWGDGLKVYRYEIPYLYYEDDLDFDGFTSDIDCDDSNDCISPGMSEIPYNGLDDDCNPLTLDDDLDQDGYDLSIDCDDNDDSIYPNAEEIPNNGIDEDCDGMDTTSATHDLGILKISIVPNPATDYLFIEKSDQLDYMVQLLTINGKLISEQTNATRFNLKDLHQGAFLIKIIELSTKRMAIEKILKI